MSDKPKKLTSESRAADKPRYEAPRVLPLNRIGVAEGGTACSTGTGVLQGPCVNGINATTDVCSTGTSAGQSCNTGDGFEF
jgi:hypothetical protein